MILPKDTNKVYFSKHLETEFAETYNSLTKILNKHQVKYDTLKGTKDIWCRDYMPIQVEKNKFVQFRYEPTYLQDYLNLQSDPKHVNKENGIKAIYSDINLDGGNVVTWADKAIISDRLFNENPKHTDRQKLIKEIENLLDAEVIIIPQINCDMTGHADGMVRFVNNNTILGNNREEEYKYWRKGINKVLEKHDLNYIDVPFMDHKIKGNSEHAIGCYINYLEVGNLIVMPIFETPDNKDQEVYDLMVNIFPEKTIETINFNDVALKGGLLNCTTWTILE